MEQLLNKQNNIPASFTIDDCFITFGVGSDLDNAIDDATSSAWYELGRIHKEPSIVNIKPEIVSIYNSLPLPQDSARNLAYELIETMNPGECIAIKVSSPSNFKKRKVLVKVEDPELELPDTIGKIFKLNTALLKNVTALTDKSESELLGSIEIKKRKIKNKVSPVKIEGKKISQWVISEDLSKGYISKYETLKDAKKEASNIMKLTPKKKINIYQINGKNNEEYVLSYKKQVTKQVALLKIELLERNEDVKEKTVGYIFVGKSPSGNEEIDA